MASSAGGAGDAWGMKPSIGDFYWPEGVKFAVAVGVFVGIGRWLAGNINPTESADYDDRFVPPTNSV
jgi:hypothetical protein